MPCRAFHFTIIILKKTFAHSRHCRGFHFTKIIFKKNKIGVGGIGRVFYFTKIILGEIAGQWEIAPQF